MQMTKAEIAATQIIVTTPEKWDVVTRKPAGEGELASVRIINNNYLTSLVDWSRGLNYSSLTRCICSTTSVVP